MSHGLNFSIAVTALAANLLVGSDQASAQAVTSEETFETTAGETYVTPPGHDHIFVCDKSKTVRLKTAWTLGFSREDAVRLNLQTVRNAYDHIGKTRLDEMYRLLHNTWVDVAAKHDLSIATGVQESDVRISMAKNVLAAVGPILKKIEADTGLSLKLQAYSEGPAALSFGAQRPTCNVGKLQAPGQKL